MAEQRDAGALALVDIAPAHADEIEWSIDSAAELYRIRGWGDDFFFVNPDGKVAVQTNPNEPAIVIADVVEDLRERNIAFPVLIRFQDVLRARVVRMNVAFADAIAEAGYANRYRGVYPIKVNQLHEVVEEVLEAGKPYGLGLECGSKAELIAALPHMEDDEALLICNGVKDAMMLRLMLAAQQIGKNVIPVVEKYHEFDKIQALGREVNVSPRFGARIRLGTSGSGKWADSGGDLSKFGISVPELMLLVEKMTAAGMPDGLALLHFHLGSQIADIQIVKQAVKEITHIYAQLAKRGLGIRYLDVGGGLGVNYGAGYSGADVGINYTLQEYANAIVYTIKEVCEAEEVAVPTIVSESGRGITAHHSVLVVPVLGAYRKDRIDPRFKAGRKDHAVIRALYKTLAHLQSLPGPKGPPRMYELLEAYHDAVEKREEADTLFSYGYLTLEDKATAERLYWSVCARIRTLVVQFEFHEPIPGELQALDEHLVDQYLCDFSIFQSILDHWSIGQGFPIMPLERLDEPPLRRAMLVDLTCDSDGKVSHYVSSNPDKRFLPVHRISDGQPYYLGFFLMGAYQDIMGDSHNLFGRVAEAHVYADAAEPDGYYIEKIIAGTTVQDMLATVQYFPNDLHRRMNEIIRQKIEAGVIRPKAGVELLEQYMRAFGATTYYDAND
ncbi:MAG: biosynthetic arginine decarboxylase [Gammaproteobacteria bacterium]|nr:biosynthetic arginine decarboxylase [Gammaproteobacteria bacterium]